jgi:hypothetical protein
MNENQKIQIVFGNSTDHQLILVVEDAEKQNEPGEIHLVHILARAGSFGGSCKTRFSKFMLQQLQIALQNFSSNAKGEFTLYSENREFWASITGDGSGQFIAHCILNDCDHRYTRLRFQVKFTSDDLQPNIQVIDKLISSSNP